VRAWFFAALFLACIALPPVNAEQPLPLRRFALVAGSNDGGEGRVRLKYAESDARSFAAVIEELGGVRSEDLVLVVSPDLARFQSALFRVQQMVRSVPGGDERRELIVYYSGHSDDEGLILGRERFPWEELRHKIDAIPADVKVAILDSCSSGSMTRTKGGVARPAFLFDASTDMKGHAFLTSSSAEEAAQESDRIEGSFFTHYLISGMRGAADTVGDGVVTLNEAYAFAFQETLASTEKTEYGPQHPAYDINLTGSGDLVLTDLRAASARVSVAEDVAGRLYFRNDRGVLAVELNKAEGQRVELGLEPGTYGVLLDAKNGRLGTQIRVSAHQRALLSLSSLRRISADRATARGADAGTADASAGDASDNPNDPVAAAAALGAAVGAAVGRAVATAITTTVDAVGPRPASSPPEEQSPRARERAPRESSYEPFHLTLLPDMTDGLFASRASHSVTVNLLVGASASSRGFEAGALANFESQGMSGFQAAGLGNVVLGDTDGWQSAGLVNVVGGEMRFVQTAGLANASFGAAFGAQIAGLGNWSAAELHGAQVAGLINWSSEELWGAQVSGVGNWSRGIHGPQISVVNVAGTVSGAQIGVVNIAGRVSGVQIGVVNISRQIDGVPIGLVSIEERGRHKVDFWWGSDGSVNTAISLGSRYFYTVFSAGWIPDSQPSPWSLGAGLGVHTPLGRLFADADLSLIADQGSFRDIASSGASDIHSRFRAVLGIPLMGELAIVGGVVVKIGLPGGTTSTAPTYSPELIVGVQI
jgi:Caspase domain